MTQTYDDERSPFKRFLYRNFHTFAYVMMLVAVMVALVFVRQDLKAHTQSNRALTEAVALRSCERGNIVRETQNHQNEVIVAILEHEGLDVEADAFYRNLLKPIPLINCEDAES